MFFVSSDVNCRTLVKNAVTTTGFTTEDEHLIKQLRVSKKYSKTVA